MCCLHQVFLSGAVIVFLIWADAAAYQMCVSAWGSSEVATSMAYTSK